MVSQLSSHMLQIARSRSSGRDEKVNSLLDRLDLRAKYGTYGDEDGIVMPFGVKPVKVQGMKDALLLTLERNPGKKVRLQYSAALVLFCWEGAKYIGEPIWIKDDIMWGFTIPHCAVLAKNRIVIAGEYGYMTNIQDVGFNCLEHTNGKWRSVHEALSLYHSTDIPKLKLSSDGKSIAPTKLVGWAYPSGLSVCQADAQIMVDCYYRFPDGRAKCYKEVTQYSPYVVMAELGQAIAKRDWVEIRKRSATSAVAIKLFALYHSLDPEEQRGNEAIDCSMLPDRGESYLTRNFELTGLGMKVHFGKLKGKWVVTRIRKG